MLSSLCFATSVSAFCSTVIYDYVPGLHAIHCDYSYGPEEIWTVPAQITKPRFLVRGADDAVGGAGGRVDAKLAVKAGTILDLKMGSNGEASSVSRGGESLLVAGGGSGKEPNFVSPKADLLKAEEPGLPIGKYLGDGSVFIEWYDARQPFELVDPLPYIVVDIFDSEKAGFAHTGSWQEWTVPEGVDHALFELFGGEGESGEPRGHIIAGLEVEPEETFSIFVGGHGRDTTLVRDGSFDVGVAAGGDTERPNYFPWGASNANEFWEGGGTGSEPEDGYAIVHYWPPEESTEVPPEDKPDVGHQPELAPPSLSLSQQPAPVCIVPSLRNKTPRAARRALANANCALNKVNRRSTGKRGMWGRVVHQSPSPGTATLASGVTITVGVPRR